jgi:hypothetical protein
MPFNPLTSNLGQTDENTNVNYSVTYTDALGISFPVTITANTLNSTINVSGNSVSGEYTESFNDTIYYRNKDDTFDTVNKFSQVNMNTYSELIHYNADTTRYKDYSYTASANGESKSYTVVVTNNWSNSKNNLLSFLNKSAGNINWRNDSYTILQWKNNAGTSINWKTE